MALQTSQVGIDLTSGTDTKTNDQISSNNHDMINVVFTGDTTAKKMNGYDLIATTPDFTDESLVFKRDKDLVAMTSLGSYKYFQNRDAFFKVSDIGSSSLEDRASAGDIIGIGVNYDSYFKNTFEVPTLGASNAINGVWSFTDKSGSFVNSITLPLSTSGLQHPFWYEKWNKCVSIGDDFYYTNIGIGQTLQVSKFSYNSGSNQFSLTASYNFSSVAGNLNVTYQDLSAMDMITDGTSIYIALKGTNLGQKFYSFNSGLSVITSSTISETITSNIELYDFNSTYILMAAVTYSGSNASFHLRSYLKSSLAFSSDSVIAVQNSPMSSSFELITVSMLPTSQTTAQYYWTVVMATSASEDNTATTNLFGYTLIKKGCSFSVNGQSSDGLIGIGKIFTHAGKYYAYMMQQLGESRDFLIVDILNMIPRAHFNRNTLSTQLNAPGLLLTRKLDSSYSTVTAPNNPIWSYPGLYAIQEQFLENGDYILGSFDDFGQTNRANFNFQDMDNQAIEVTRKSFISGAIPSLYDGVSLVENDFIGQPFLTITSYGGSGLLPANNGYNLVACYSWKDANGLVYRGPLSNTLGSIEKIPLPDNSLVSIDVYTPLVSAKTGVRCEVYIINGLNSDFQLVADLPVSAGPADTQQSIVISNYPAALTRTLYTGIDEANQLQNLPASSMKASALYADRIFYVKNGDDNTVYFSQKKVPTEGFSFNEESLLLRVYDKRGFNEGGLTGLIAMDGRLFIFKDNSILYTIGDGPSLNGGSSDLISPQLVTTDVGCISSRSIVLVPEGIMFMSDKGIYLLDRKLNVAYIGASVEQFNQNTVTSAILLENVNEVRFTTLDGEILVYNYFNKAWSWHTDLPIYSATICNNVYTPYLTNGRVYNESLVHKKIVEGASETAIIQKISTPWVRVQEKQAWEKVYQLLCLGRYKSEHNIQISFFYDYELYASDVYVLNPLTGSQYNISVRPTNTQIESGSLTDGVYQISVDMVRKNCQAFRVEIQDIPLNISSNTGESFALSNISVTFGGKKGPAKTPDSKSY